jgi:hypothetical protein
MTKATLLDTQNTCFFRNYPNQFCNNFDENFNIQPNKSSDQIDGEYNDFCNLIELNRLRILNWN